MPNAVHIRNMPDDLWKQIKVEAAWRGVPIREIVIDALRSYAQEGHKSIFRRNKETE